MRNEKERSYLSLRLQTQRGHQIDQPPSTIRLCPVMNRPASLANNNTAPARSSGFPMTPSGLPLRPRSTKSGLAVSFGMKPGLMQLALIRNGPSSAARLRVRPMMPAFAD